MYKKIAIVGYGRFGKVLHNLIKDQSFEIIIIKKDSNLDIIKDVDVIFYAVPISSLSEVVDSHKPYLSDQLIIDVLSVKLHPKKIIENLIIEKPKIKAILTHPMFGPDSLKAKGIEGQPIILDQFTAEDIDYNFWKDLFHKLKLHVIEMSADEHDLLAARSQGLTHFVGRMLSEFDFAPTSIDSSGAEKLHEVMNLTTNDTWQLFIDLQSHNPYTKQMRLDLGLSFDNLYNKILPKQVSPDSLTFGIQGGKGSFNEEALSVYLEKEKISNVTIEYLYTSENVLNSLYKGDIDFGIFAIHNSTGGIVQESVHAMSNYKFDIIEEFSIKISHSLMIKPSVEFSKIDTIMTHPQVLKQCKDTLTKRYPDLTFTSGEGDLIDHANVAKRLSNNDLADNIGTMGSKILASIYNLKIIKDNLQDNQENYTSFIIISRKK